MESKDSSISKIASMYRRFAVKNMGATKIRTALCRCLKKMPGFEGLWLS